MGLRSYRPMAPRLKCAGPWLFYLKKQLNDSAQAAGNLHAVLFRSVVNRSIYIAFDFVGRLAKRSVFEHRLEGQRSGPAVFFHTEDAVGAVRADHGQSF